MGTPIIEMSFFIFYTSVAFYFVWSKHRCLFNYVFFSLIQPLIYFLCKNDANFVCSILSVFLSRVFLHAPKKLSISTTFWQNVQTFLSFRLKSPIIFAFIKKRLRHNKIHSIYRWTTVDFSARLRFPRTRWALLSNQQLEATT